MDTGQGPLAHGGGFRRIVLCVDSSDASRCAAEFTRRLASAGKDLTVVAVVPGPRLLAPHDALVGLDLGMVHSQVLEDAERAVIESSDRLAQTGAVVRTHVIDLAAERSDVAHALARAALVDKADLMVLGTRQHRGFLRWLDPSVTEALSKIAPAAMIVVPDGYANPSESFASRILFAVDGSPAALAALSIGARMATSLTQVRAVYVVDRAVRYSDFVPVTLLEDALIKEGERAIAAAAQRLRSIGNVARSNISAGSIATDISADDVPHALLREAERWNADLIVMGTHGRRGVQRALFGSVANRVACESKVPVMLVRE
ncbi:universal stress protein [Caballeronia grimmiae]|uniref:universal stress protein n=1 Tax=Caballeronia grimmiae TaxID=1071679 RepID=UPI0038BD1558